MQAHTKRIAIIALIALLVSGAGVGVLVSEITRGGTALTEHAAVLSEHAAKKEARARLSREAQVTKPQRERLVGYFLETPDDGINFLTAIEILADEFGLSGNTQDLTESGDTETPYIDVDFSFTGTREAVVGFAEALEYVPYDAELRSLELGRLGSSGGWEGTVTIRVSTLSL